LAGDRYKMDWSKKSEDRSQKSIASNFGLPTSDFRLRTSDLAVTFFKIQGFNSDMKKLKNFITNLLIILSFGIVPAIICQLFIKKPIDRYIHITSFRYGKEPSVIRCNRGDKLHLTFSTNDTGHSFFLQEFDIDAKISPARDDVAVFKTSDPTAKPELTRELVFTARHPGVLNYLVSKSNFRCHVWCGPMHAFEQGKLIILPNTLLIFSLGILAGILFLWIFGIFRRKTNEEPVNNNVEYHELFTNSAFFKRIIVSRWPQIILTIIAMALIYVVILTATLGTKVSGRNLGVLMMWAIWLFLLVAILTPFFGRIWCTICPLPFLGDLIQRRSSFVPERGKTKGFNNKFYGLSLAWPVWLSNNWLKLFVFLLLATFSTTLVATPVVSGLTVLGLLLIPTMMSLIWGLRTFCRYVCPVSVFVAPHARMSPLALRSKSQTVCDNCKPSFCQKGSVNGWACPYGLNVGEIKENTDCGLCLECTRSCMYNNVSLYRRPFGSELGIRNLSEAWLTIALFILAIVYCVLYEGHWPVVRDYVNIMDKHNWGLFGIYTLILWTLVLAIIPGIIFLLAYTGSRLSKTGMTVKDIFLVNTGALLPLSLMLWIPFVIPMLFVNITFIIQSASDPFGWGWDFFGTANIPWHQFMPRLIPWLQAIILLTGFYLSLRNLKKSWLDHNMKPKQLFLLMLPMAFFITCIVVAMLFFFTN
jgi:heme/copper-type cytochrome/quinol oxidase subunit 2